ncbi:MAG: DUF3576 domain-containing protein [Pseudomonadota bacterium]
MKKIFLTLTIIPSVFAVAACSSVTDKLPKGEAKYPSGADRTTTGDDIYGERESILGKDGFKIFGKKDRADDGSTGIGVNSFLWRAALDTVSFMPLASADPFGGVIITDWYIDPATPNERYKVNVFILDRQLVSSGVQVKVFREMKSGSTWKTSTVADDTGRKLEDAILTRARQLRVAANAEE